VNLGSDWQTAKQLAISALRRAIKEANLEEKVALGTLKKRNPPESLYARDGLSSLDTWITSKYAAWKKQIGS